MKELGLFRNMTDDDIKSLLKILEARVVNFKKSMTVMSNLNNTNDVGILLKGTASLVEVDYSGNKTIMLNFVRGDIFGGKFTDYQNEELSIVADTDLEILFVEFDRVFKEKGNNRLSKVFSINLIDSLIDKINSYNIRIEILTKKTIRDKLLKYFHTLEKLQNSNNIKLPFSFTTLSDYLAIDRSAMYRELKNLKEEGFIESNGREITIIYR